MNKVIRIVFDDDVSQNDVDVLVGDLQVHLDVLGITATLFVGEEEQCDGDEDE